jgi:hypothetical protein
MAKKIVKGIFGGGKKAAAAPADEAAQDPNTHKPVVKQLDGSESMNVPGSRRLYRPQMDRKSTILGISDKLGTMR